MTEELSQEQLTEYFKQYLNPDLDWRDEVYVNRSTNWKIRHGRTSGQFTDLKQRCANLLTSTENEIADALDGKYDFIGEVVTLGKRIIDSTPLTGRGTLKSEGFTDTLNNLLISHLDPQISAVMDPRAQTLRKCLRNFRTEMVVEVMLGDDKEFNEVFLQAASKVTGKYLNDYLGIPPSQLRPSNRAMLAVMASAATKIDTKDPTGLVDFYKALYATYGESKLSARRIGTFIPYEIDLLQEYLRLQNNNGRQLSVFDRILLGNTLSEKIGWDVEPRSILAENLSNFTGIKHHRSSLSIHRSLILEGKPYIDDFNSTSEE